MLSASWADYLQPAVARKLAALPASTIVPELADTIRRRFAAALPVLAATRPAFAAHG